MSEPEHGNVACEDEAGERAGADVARNKIINVRTMVTVCKDG